MIGLVIFLITDLAAPLLFYFFAYRIPNRQWLNIYFIFCFAAATVLIFYPRQTSLIHKINSSDGFVKAGYLLTLLLIFTSCVGAAVGTLSKMILLSIEQNKIDSLEEWQIHAASICLIVFAFPLVWILALAFE